MSKRFIYLLTLALFISACSNTKYLPANEKLYTGVRVNIKKDSNTTRRERKDLTTELTDLTRPKPNASILGLRVKLWL